MGELRMLQAEWVLLAVLGGLAAMFFLIAGYVTLWQPRTPPQDADTPRKAGRWFRDIPWILLFLYVAGIAFIVVYMSAQAADPPNW